MPYLLPMHLFFILTSSALFHLAPSIPLSNQRHLIPCSAHRQSNSPLQDAQPNTLVNGVPNDFFSKSKLNQKSPNETSRSSKFGLWATGSTVPEKTILLNDGVAKYDATFTLLLREGEELKGMRHRPDDTSVITSFEEARERHVTNLVSYNITITHHFRGTVGVAKYELTIFTTKGAALRVMGVYYVAGIVLYASLDSKPPRIVSGIDFPPLTVDSISSFSSFTDMSTHHRVMFPLKFQHVGPDVNPAPPSIIDQLSKAVISVESMTVGDGKPILSNDSSCEIMRKKFYSTPSNKSREDDCDVRLDLDSMSLLLNFNPEGYGKAIIDISLPGTLAAGDGMKTKIRLNVLRPAIIRPELDLKDDLRLRLDYFGSESFSLPIRNKNKDDQQRKVLSYILDLPGNRYAISDFNSSSLDGSTQFISFTVISKDREDKKLQKAIQKALTRLRHSQRQQRGKISYIDIRELHYSQNMSNSVKNEFSGPFGSTIAEQVSNELRIMPVDLAREMNDSYQSHVHALFPRIDELVTAENPSEFNIWTSFSSEEVAQVEPLRVVRGRQNMLFKLILLRYTISTFSQHKAMQISRSLSDLVSEICKTRVEGANLVKIEDKGLNVEATYHLAVPMKSTDSDVKLDMYKKNISRSVSRDVLLKSDRLEVKEIIRLVRLWHPTGEESTASEASTTSEASNRLKGIKGILLGVFVGLSVVILIPLLILCIGYLLSSRRAVDSSNHENERGEEEEPENKELDGKSVELPQPASEVLKDNYGRADEGSYRSFNVGSEMARQGYYGDKSPAATQKTTTFAET